MFSLMKAHSYIKDQPLSIQQPQLEPLFTVPFPLVQSSGANTSNNSSQRATPTTQSVAPSTIPITEAWSGPCLTLHGDNSLSLAQLSAFEAHEISNPNATHPVHSQPDTNFIISTNSSSPAAQRLVDIISPTLPQTPVVLNHQLTVLFSSHNTHSIIIRTKYHSVKHKKI
jgi:hypothetical protein